MQTAIKNVLNELISTVIVGESVQKVEVTNEKILAGNLTLFVITYYKKSYIRTIN